MELNSLEHIELVGNNLEKRLNLISNLGELETFKLEFLGKNGNIVLAFKALTLKPEEEAIKLRIALNNLKTLVLEGIGKVGANLKHNLCMEKLAKASIDVTLPAPKVLPITGDGAGSLLAQEIFTIKRILDKMRVKIVSGPVVDSDFYNFTLLNLPEHHPARGMHDTFYLEGVPGYLLRTHTSNVQVRELQNFKYEPGVHKTLSIASVGEVFRSDDDATHSPMFNQIEMMEVWQNQQVTLEDLLHRIYEFLNNYFGYRVNLRIRPSYFPFTDPSYEVDMFVESKGKWMEILGCGMIHCEVLKNSPAFDLCKLSGFAFGMGVERIIMLKYGIGDLRHFFSADPRIIRYLHNLNNYGN